jgi:hypothetical protein
MPSSGPVRRSGRGTAGAWWVPGFLSGELRRLGRYLVELFGKSLAFGSGGVEIGFCSFGADTERGSCFFERGNPGVGCCVELVAFALGVGPDERDFPGCLSLGGVSALLGAA